MPQHASPIIARGRYLQPYEQATVGRSVWRWANAVGRTPDEATENAIHDMERSRVNAQALVRIQGQ